MRLGRRSTRRQLLLISGGRLIQGVGARGRLIRTGLRNRHAAVGPFFTQATGARGSSAKHNENDRRDNEHKDECNNVPHNVHRPPRAPQVTRTVTRGRARPLGGPMLEWTGFPARDATRESIVPDPRAGKPVPHFRIVLFPLSSYRQLSFYLSFSYRRHYRPDCRHLLRWNHHQGHRHQNPGQRPSLFWIIQKQSF